MAARVDMHGARMQLRSSRQTDAAWYGGAPALPNHLAIARFVFLGN
jgi:hypothetical protein